jgi:guanine deaminase
MNKKFVQLALEEAYKGMRAGDGGPFGAVVVKDGIVVASGHNEVLKHNDPTNHAEMVAIRKAAKKLGRFDLSDCELYITSEPCPMCFSAIHWAKMRKIYFACTRGDAADIGFDDKFIYDVLQGKTKKKQVISVQVGREECLPAFLEWKKKSNKTMY